MHIKCTTQGVETGRELRKLWLREDLQGSEVAPTKKTERSVLPYVISQQLWSDTCLKFSLHENDISDQALLYCGGGYPQPEALPSKVSKPPRPQPPGNSRITCMSCPKRTQAHVCHLHLCHGHIRRQDSVQKRKERAPSPRFQKTNHSLGKIYFDGGKEIPKCFIKEIQQVQILTARLWIIQTATT